MWFGIQLLPPCNEMVLIIPWSVIAFSFVQKVNQCCVAASLLHWKA